jgi:hypothetical protein
MKYLCLIYSNEQVLHTSPDSPADVYSAPGPSRPCCNNGGAPTA